MGIEEHVLQTIEIEHWLSSLTDWEIFILAVIEANGNTTYTSLAKQLGISYDDLRLTRRRIVRKFQRVQDDEL